MSGLWHDAAKPDDGAPRKPKGFSEEHLKIMGDYLSKHQGHKATSGESEEALTNLTRLFEWLYKHRKDLRRGAN